MHEVCCWKHPHLLISALLGHRAKGLAGIRVEVRSRLYEDNDRHSGSSRTCGELRILAPSFLHRLLPQYYQRFARIGSQETRNLAANALPSRFGNDEAILESIGGTRSTTIPRCGCNVDPRLSIT